MPATEQGRLPMSRPRGPSRQALLAKVHVAKKQLNLADENYRDIVARVTGRDSAAGCDTRQLDALLREFRRLGWQGTTKNLSAKPIVRMIYRVWADLEKHIAHPGDAALRAFVQRQTKTEARPEGISAPEFLSVAEATKVLEGLKAWLRRERTKGAA